MIGQVDILQEEEVWTGACDDSTDGRSGSTTYQNLDMWLYGEHKDIMNDPCDVHI